MTAGSACTMSTAAEIAAIQGVTSSPWWITTCIVAQIASFSISAVQFSMYSLESNYRRDSISASMLDLPGRYLMTKLKSASSASHRCPLRTTWLTTVFKWIVVRVDSEGGGVEQVITKLLSYRPFEGKEL